MPSELKNPSNEYDAIVKQMIQADRECAAGVTTSCIGKAPSMRPKQFDFAEIGILMLFALILAFIVLKKPWHRRPNKETRLAISAMALWLLTVQLWGIIWGWGRYFDEIEYAALHISMPLLVVVFLLGKWWTRQAP